MVVPALVMAVLLVVAVLVAAKVMNKDGTGASGLFQSIDSLGKSSQVTALEQERELIVAMTAATKTLTVAAKPATADPTQILAAQQSASTGIQTGTGITGSAPPANPTSAMQIGEAELVDYGFSKATQWTCLYNLWQRESGWNVYAQNPSSGAYGIPQSLPGDKMAMFGSDYLTDPTTQIKWGLWYIKTTYGTPCAAWQNEVEYGSY